MVNIGVSGKILTDVGLVIFDKDGTLVGLYDYWAGMVSLRVEVARKRLGFDKGLAGEIMYDMGVDTEKGRLRSTGPVGVKKREVVMQAMVDSLERIGFEGTRSLCEEAFREADRLSEAQLSRLVKPVKGMYGLISALKKRGCLLGLATTDKTWRAELVLEHLGIRPSIDFVVGEDMVRSPKPAPDMVELIVKEAGVGRGSTVVVGDAVTDIEMGRRAGVLASIGVLSGITPEEGFQGMTDLVVPDISGIEVL